MTKDPSPDDTQLELARIQRSIGEALRAQGDPAGALATDRKAAGILGELTAKAPAQALWQRAGLEVMTRLVALDPTNADWRQDLGELHRENGDASKAASHDAARDEYEACAGITEPMVSRGSANKKLAELAAYCRSQITPEPPSPT